MEDKRIIREIENKEPPKGGSLLVSTDDIKRLFDLIPKNRLYLSYDKEHLDPHNKLKLSDKEWEDFVDEGNSSDEVFDRFMEVGQDLLDDWSITNLNK